MTVLRYQDYASTREFQADVAVVGTGAGGAVVGAELAEAGFDVVFVEEGAYHATSTFNPYLKESAPRLYRDAGTTTILGTALIGYLEGRCVGGSTVINGGMAYRAPESVLRHWEEVTRASELSPKAMEPLYARIEERVHAQYQMRESVGGDNRVMREAARRKGWNFTENRRNQDRCTGANNCVLGCPTGGKQSTLVSYIPRALEAGARCLTEVRADRLLIEDGACAGVTGRAIDPSTMKKTHRVTVRAKAVVVAAGAVQTPYLLLRHKLGRPSGQLGKNFLCHPNVKVIAAFPFEVKGWKGVSQWGQMRALRQEGILFAENMVPPAALGTQLPFVGGKAWELMRRYNNMVVSGALIEDSTTGVVKRGPFGMALPRYEITAYDLERILKAARILAEMFFDLGATDVLLPFSNLHLVHSPDELKQLVPEKIQRKHVDLFTAHIMGTARMGSEADRSVVDLKGELWDLKGCYVADASIFPSAIGVNPQITIMALATMIGWRLAETLKHPGRKVA